MKRSVYRLRVPRSVAQLIRGLHPQLKKKVGTALEDILEDPQRGKPLKEELSGLWSFHVGRSRIIYRISKDRIIDLVAIGPRERIYETTFRLVSKDVSG